MADLKPDPSRPGPFGVYPRRAVWPLVLLIVIFTFWFAFLVWMAVKYPAW
jgi:hypothetical protein